ncbi:MAG: hypothetical protein ACP5QR_04960 [Rhizomicrobium sp.]
MPPFFATLMAKISLTAIIIAALVLMVVVQTVQLYGFGLSLPIIGHVTIAEGAIPARDEALKALGQAQANAETLQAGLDKANASIAALAARGRADTAKAQTAVDKAAQAQAALSVARHRLASVPGSKEVCPSVQAIFLGAFQ